MGSRNIRLAIDELFSSRSASGLNKGKKKPDSSIHTFNVDKGIIPAETSYLKAGTLAD